jgi:alpha-N-arabinofuranosidase
MVSRDMAPGLLASEAAGPRYASRALGFFERVSDVPTLDVLATRTPEGAPGPAVATILLINKSVTATAVARVSLRGSAGAERLVTQTLTGAAVDANTGTELPRVPGLNWAAQREAGPGGRFRRGAPDEVRIVRDERANPGAQSELRVPPHSLMLLRFEGLRRP